MCSYGPGLDNRKDSEVLHGWHWVLGISVARGRARKPVCLEWEREEGVDGGREEPQFRERFEGPGNSFLSKKENYR